MWPVLLSEMSYVSTPTFHVPNLISYLGSTVDSDVRTLDVPNLICGEKKYHPYYVK